MITCEGIIKNIQNNKTPSLYSDIKSIVGRSKTSSSLCGSLCQVLKALCKHIISLDKCSEELTVLEPSIRLCLDHLQKHFQSNDLKNYQLDRILYYIITSFIKSELYESAQYCAEYLKAYLKDLSIFTSEDSTLAVIKNVSIIFWNAAHEYEKHSNKEFKHNLALQFRAVGLDFMLMDKKCKENVVDKVCIALQKYWIDNPNQDMFQCSMFFKKIWTQMLMKKVYILDQIIFFKLCYFFNNFLLRYGRKNEFFIEVNACLQELYNQLVLEEEENHKEVQVFIDILKYSINIFTLRSSTAISPKTFTLWIMTFKASHTSEDLSLLYNTLHIFQLHFCDCASYLNLSLLSDDMKEFLETILTNFNALELLVNEYLKLPSVEGLHKDSSSLHTCKIRISSALIRFYHWVLQNEPDKKKFYRLLKRACQFINKSFQFFNLKSLQKHSEEEKAFVNFGIIVNNVAKMLFKYTAYDEAVQLFQISIGIDLSSEIKDKNHMPNLWTKQELLIYSYMLSHQHLQALINVVKTLFMHENKNKECLELWMKIKRDVLRSKDTTLASKTIADAISESNISFTTEKIALLLIEELKYCKLERCNMVEEMFSVANQLLAMPCTGIIRADMLFELVSSSLCMKKKSLLLDGKGSLVELCQEAIQLFRDYLVINPRDNEKKLKLSVVYFWFHLITFQQMYVIIETEAKKETPPTPVKEAKVPINDDEDDTCVIQPGIQFVTLSVETKALENLDHAFQLWTEISEDSQSSWMQLKDIVKDLGILDVIQSSAQNFATAVHDLKEWRLSVLLLEVAVATGSKIHELTACTSLITFAVRLGYLEIASHFVKYGLALLRSEVTGEKHTYQSLRFYLAQSNYYLHIEKFDEGLEILQNVLEDSIFDYQSTKSSKLLKSEILLVLSHYLTLSESAFSNNQNFKKLSSSTTFLNAANECALICQGLFMHESSEENQNSDVLRNSLYYKPKLIHTLLVSHLLVGQLFMQIGAPREARYYLQQGLVIAQPHILTYWCSKFLTILGQLDLLCDSPKDCQVKLNGLKYIMNNELKETIAAILLRHYENIEVTEHPCSPEENFIISKSGQDIKKEIRQKFLEKYDDVFASPVAKRKTARISADPNLDKYNKCGLFSLQFARFEIYMLKSLQLITEGSIEAAISELKRTLQEYEVLCKSTALSKEISLVKSNLFQINNLLHRTPQEIDANSIISISIQLSIIYSSVGKFNEANDQIKQALDFLHSITKSPKILYHNLYCLVKYQEIITSIKSLVCSKGQTRVEYQLFPVKKRTQFARSKTLKKNNLTESSLLHTPKTLPVPKIYVTDYTTGELCHAPTKKDVLPTHIKQDLDSPDLKLPQTPTFTPLYFSSSEGEDSAFITPKKSDSKNGKTVRSKRLMWKSSKDKMASLDDKIGYKFFKSKSTNTISSSGDIWRLPISSMSSEIKCLQQDSSASVRKTRSSRLNTTTKKETYNPLSGLTKAPQKRSSRTKKLVQSASVEIYNDTKSEVKKQFRNSRKLIKSTSDSVERARSSSRNKSGSCYQDSSDDENNHIVICDSYESDVFCKVKTPKPEFKEVNSLFNDLCNNFATISVSNEDVKENSQNSNAAICSQDTRKKHITSVLSGDKVQQFITKLLEIRLLMQHNPIFPLYSDVCKLLAFLIFTEPSNHQEDFEEQMLKSGLLLSETFAITLRHHFISTMKKKVKKGEQNFEGQLIPTVQGTEHALPEMMKSMIKALPEDWTVVQISTVPEKEAVFDTGKRLLPKLIVCQYRKNALPIVCCIDHTQDVKFTSSFFEDFEDIQKQNVLIMSNKDKKSWWRSRIALNNHLKELSQCMDNIWLGCWKGLLLGLPTDQETIQNLKDETDEIMKIAPIKNKQLLQVLLDSASFLHKDQISEAICYLWECTPFDDVHSKICNSIFNLSSSNIQCKRHPVILILDKDIQALPWECMPILQDIPVSRVPSMSLLMSQLNSNSFSKVENGVDSSQTFYILNPSGDLSDTQGRFEDSFKRQTEWKGISGRIPTAKEYASAFENEVFIYCGHGSGKTYLEGMSIDRIQCKAATVIMGCSSGRIRQLGRQFEPHGIGFRYWLNGCPCVVANLWDVTDKDIDKFTEEFLSMWMPNYKTDNSTLYNVSKATSVSRRACKLKYLIGGAPVVFGLPVFARK